VRLLQHETGPGRRPKQPQNDIFIRLVVVYKLVTGKICSSCEKLRRQSWALWFVKSVSSTA
jgi:hypothetical protein